MEEGDPILEDRGGGGDRIPSDGLVVAIYKSGFLTDISCNRHVEYRNKVIWKRWKTQGL